MRSARVLDRHPRMFRVQVMRTHLLPALLGAAVLAAAATPAAAQSAASAPTTLKLTVDEAVKMALGANLDLAADRLDPQIGDTQVAAAAGAFRPSVSSSVQRNNQLQPPASFL